MSSSEKGDPDQCTLFAEDVEVAEGQLAAAGDAANKALGKTPWSTPPTRRNKSDLPGHLERVEEVIEPESTLCPCGSGEMARVGEARNMRLDVEPAQVRVLVTVRPKYMFRTCAGLQSTQDLAPELLVSRGLGTDRVVLQSVVSKLGDHCPLYSQAEIWCRQGIEIDRKSRPLACILHDAGHLGRARRLPPVSAHRRHVGELWKSVRLFPDETTVPALAPGTGKAR